MQKKTNNNNTSYQHAAKRSAKSTVTFAADVLRNLVIGVVVASIIVGGLSGLVFGTLASTNSDVSTWIQRNVLGQINAGQVTTDAVDTDTIITVDEDSATIDAVEKVTPSVVSIVVTQDLAALYDSTGPNVFPFGDLFNFSLPYEPPQGEQQVGAGTGFIITSDGMIVTNKHVVDVTDASYTVILNNGTEYEATVLDTDPFNDIAIIKIDADNLTPLALGDSDDLEIGQTVIAIGNALGQYQNSVTRGIVSGLSRTITAGSASQSETLENIIQTDAAINFGNSGGPLINLAGQVVGVNTAISREGQLLGFAIPINQAKRAIDSVQEYGEIVRPYLGVRYMLLNEQIAERNNLSVKQGALLVRGDEPTELAVIPGSPADKAGLEENDIILEVNDQEINEGRSLAKLLQQYNPGDTVTLTVLHDGEEKQVSATLEQVEN